MSTPAADSGPIQNFIRSLYSAAFYSEVPWLGLGVGFRNLFLLAAILGVVSATQWSAATGSGLRTWQARVEAGEMPAMGLENGRLQVVGPQPWVDSDPAGGWFIIDTTGAWTGVPDSMSSGLFVGPDRAEYKTAPDVSRVYEFAGQSLPYRLDGPGIAQTRKVLVPLMLIVMSPVALLYYATVNLILALLIAAMATGLMRVFRPVPRLSYKSVLTVALFILTPVSLLFKFMGLVTPDLAAMFRPFYPALAASLLLAALSASTRPGGDGEDGDTPNGTDDEGVSDDATADDRFGAEGGKGRGDRDAAGNGSDRDRS